MSHVQKVLNEFQVNNIHAGTQWSLIVLTGMMITFVFMLVVAVLLNQERATIIALIIGPLFACSSFAFASHLRMNQLRKEIEDLKGQLAKASPDTPRD